MPWETRFETGHDGIDGQHRTLVGLLDRVRAADVDDREVGLQIVRDLMAYVVEHFQYEQELMDRLAYPGRGAHRHEHAKLIEQVTGFVDQVSRGDLLLADLHLLLVDWVQIHICGEDHRLGAFLTASPGAAVSPDVSPAPTRPDEVRSSTGPSPVEPPVPAPAQPREPPAVDLETWNAHVAAWERERAAKRHAAAEQRAQRRRASTAAAAPASTPRVVEAAPRASSTAPAPEGEDSLSAWTAHVAAWRREQDAARRTAAERRAKRQEQAAAWRFIRRVVAEAAAGERPSEDPLAKAVLADELACRVHQAPERLRRIIAAVLRLR